jgi:hypothetical protein
LPETELSLEEFQAVVQPLVGLPVSLPWKGYGSTIFLELGELAPLGPRQRHNRGQACIHIDWDWRVEAEAAILYGSSNSGPKIAAGIDCLRDTTLQSLSIIGHVPELAIRFSNGHRLRSMAMRTGDPEWSIRLTDGRWVCPRGGRLLVGEGGSTVTAERRAAFALAERAASRWGIPVVEPKGGFCMNCSSFVRLDGNGHMLDYGVCLADAGPFDGQIVNCRSGCQVFSKD